MKTWISGDIFNDSGKHMRSYLINPEYIIAIDLNDRRMMVKDFKSIYPLYYSKEDEHLILDLVSGKWINES